MEVDRRKQQLEKFVPTRATVAPLESTKLNKSVVITGPPGCGKTLTAYHVALELKEKGYDFLLVRDPNNIIKYAKRNRKQFISIDDIFGKRMVDETTHNGGESKTNGFNHFCLKTTA